MGIEYSLRFKVSSSEATTRELLRIPGAVVRGDGSEVVEFRAAGDRGGGMPDATARAEDGGLYFRVNGGDGRSIFGHVVARMVSTFGALEIEEL